MDIFPPTLYQELNKSLELDKFPSAIKLANVTPVFKKEDRTKKEKCRLISLSSNLSKVFERCLACITSFLYFLIIYFQNTNAGLEKALMLSSI